MSTENRRGDQYFAGEMKKSVLNRLEGILGINPDLRYEDVQLSGINVGIEVVDLKDPRRIWVFVDSSASSDLSRVWVIGSNGDIVFEGLDSADTGKFPTDSLEGTFSSVKLEDVLDALESIEPEKKERQKV